MREKLDTMTHGSRFLLGMSGAFLVYGVILLCVKVVNYLELAP